MREDFESSRPDAHALAGESVSAQHWLRYASASAQTATDHNPATHGLHSWTAQRGLSRRTLALALAYMENNLGESFTLNDLGRAIGISPFHFSRLFRISTGQSPMGYLRRLRIERSKTMLLQGERKKADIAMTLGFSDQSHFTRTFRRMTGVSPGEYVRRSYTMKMAA